MPYGDPNSQRNAIVQALMNVASPPPRTQAPPMPGQFGATASPAAPSVMGPQSPGIPAPGGGALGVGGAAGVTPSPTAATGIQPGSVPGGMSSPFAQGGGIKPLAPPMTMPPAPAGPGPMGPPPLSQNLVGQQPAMGMPGTQMPVPGMPTPTPPLGTY